MCRQRIDFFWHGLRSSWRFSNRFLLLFQRLFYRSAPIVTYCHEDKWWLVADSRVGDHEMVKEVLANGEYASYLNTIMAGGQCRYVNIGANIGAFDIAVAARGEIPYALAVELNPSTHTRLLLNLQLNRLDSIRALQGGIAGENGTFEFVPSGCAYRDSLHSPPPPSNQRHAAARVPLYTLGKALEVTALDGREWDLLKLDCEGAEYGIIKQTPRELLRRFKHIILELHQPPTGESVDDLAARLVAAGFGLVPGSHRPKGENELCFWVRNPHTS